MDAHSRPQPARSPSSFQTTCWTEVLQVARTGSEGENAFAQFYRSYWDPIYAYVRRRGHDHFEAEELTQEFFVGLFTHQRLARLQREGGRFRSFLLTSMQNFLANERDKARAAKRGGGERPASLHDPVVEQRVESVPHGTPAELVYDREWALLIMRRTMQSLEKEYAEGGRQRVFEALKLKIQGDAGGPSYQDLAQSLATSEGNIKVMVHRLRERFRNLLRDEIGRTVEDPGQVQDEMRYLLTVLST